MKHILVAENDAALARTIQLLLTSKGWEVTQVPTIRRAAECLDEMDFDVLLVDRMLDDGDGLELVKYCRDTSFATHIVCLTQLGEVHDRISGLGVGADDYIGKPFSGTELILRLSNLLHKQKILSANHLTVGNLQLSPETGELQIGEKVITLRKREAEILGCLLKYKNQVVTRDTLINHVWRGNAEIPSYSTLDVYIRRLRIRLADQRRLIQTVRGFGYMIKS